MSTSPYTEADPPDELSELEDDFASKPPAADDKLDAGVFKIAGVVVIAAIMSILDMTVVSVAIPTFQTDFNSSYAIVAWTMTGYTLALATVIPLTGWAADRFGTKRLFMMALVLFVAGSVLCSIATSIGELIAFRVLQGLGGGMLMPLGMTIMTHAAGPARVGRVMAVLGVPMLLGPIGGPILGGWLIESASWHWIFLINVPIGAVALAAAFFILPSDDPSPSQSFDFLGMLLLSPGLALFLFGVSSIPEEHTIMATRVLLPAAIGVALIIGFVFHALRTVHPLIDLHLFKNRQLTISVLSMSLFGIAFFGAGLLFPSYFLQVRGETTLDAGLLMAPQGLGAMLTMPLAGQLVDKIGPGKIVLTGIAFIAVGMAAFTQVGPDTSYVFLLGALFVMGLGMGATMMPIMTAALQTLSHAEVARGSTLMNIVNQVAGSIGTATMSVVLTNLMTKGGGGFIAYHSDPKVMAEMNEKFKDQPEALHSVLATGKAEAATAFGHTYWVAVVLVILTLIPASFLPRKKVETTDGDAAPVLMH